MKCAWIVSGLALWISIATAAEAIEQNTTKAYVILAVDAKNFGGRSSDSIELDRQTISSLFVTSIPKSDLQIINIARGETISGKAILEAVENVPSDSNDTIVFYYSGHGAVDDDQGRYLQLSGSSELLRSDLINALKKKSAKLKVLITDCCAAEAELPLIESSAPKRKPATEWTELARALFRESSGFVDISSSTRPELSWISKTGEGSIFTIELSKLAMDRADLSGVTWKDFFELLKGRTVESSANERGKANKQTPELISLELSGRRLGIDVQRNPEGGVKVLRVIEGLPASRAGLEPGDIIFHWNDVEVRDAKHFGDLVDESQGEVKLKVVNVKDGQEYVVVLSF